MPRGRPPLLPPAAPATKKDAARGESFACTYCGRMKDVEILPRCLGCGCRQSFWRESFWLHCGHCVSGTGWKRCWGIRRSRKIGIRGRRDPFLSSLGKWQEETHKTSKNAHELVLALVQCYI